ncbi:hypothetical protein AVEN_217566-1 [Araneus ventricosus]|uniref:Reverse transcriptase Ty1/copia-type domain-containing protein n=1 Tax=Araneus ventricosus TaxID=182803 RepID=A0A4Y2P029_ARAVE|nr:hypothetical protein AVEN_273382-1 [Araneus ventricosus]GBN45213.1 hypothetical protein AVEN_72259-1 [Araneus ventricosus]GBN45228.1 hypothetical protein AVEN_145239-1 [Araneus ventricosus]GBN45265.1 hypothetical protein AVEN_217566-1 [Araneus ventricosus]
MQEELNVMQERKVWHLVDLPPNIDPIGCRWVFALKRNEMGEVVRYKARLVGQVFSDSDFAACRDDRVSMGRQIIFIGQAPIMWRTFKKKCISLSTIEAEFIALTEAAKEMTWFDRILGECRDRKIIEEIQEKSTLC